MKTALIAVGATLATLFVIGLFAVGFSTEAVVVYEPSQSDAPNVQPREPEAVQPREPEATPVPVPSEPEWFDGSDEFGHFEYRYEGREYFERGYDEFGYYYEYHSEL